MAYTPTPDELADLKVALGITDAATDSLLTLVLVQTGAKVLNEINQSTMPALLLPIISEMAADAYRLSQAGTIGPVSSISDNGQSVSYDQTVTRSVSAVLKNYTGQLARFTKPGW